MATVSPESHTVDKGSLQCPLGNSKLQKSKASLQDEKLAEMKTDNRENCLSFPSFFQKLAYKVLLLVRLNVKTQRAREVC